MEQASSSATRPSFPSVKIQPSSPSTFLRQPKRKIQRTSAFFFKQQNPTRDTEIQPISHGNTSDFLQQLTTKILHLQKRFNLATHQISNRKSSFIKIHFDQLHFNHELITFNRRPFQTIWTPNHNNTRNNPHFEIFPSADISLYSRSVAFALKKCFSNSVRSFYNFQRGRYYTILSRKQFATISITFLSKQTFLNGLDITFWTNTVHSTYKDISCQIIIFTHDGFLKTNIFQMITQRTFRS